MASVLEIRGDGPRRSRASTSQEGRGTSPRRTTFHEDGLHVATLVEYVDDSRKGLGFCRWTVAGTGGRSDDYETADKQIREELDR